MTKTCAILFDFDLTLVNSKPGGVASFRALCQATRIKPTKELEKIYFGKRVSESMIFFSKNSRVKISPQELYKIYLKSFKAKISQTKVYGKEILSYLQKNKIKIVIISANSESIIKLICKHFKLSYDLLITDNQMPKKSEKSVAITQAIRKLKLKKGQVFYVGDHINDIIQGKKAGVRVISVTTGFYKANDLKKYNPDYIIKNLNEIKKIIE